MFLCSRPGCQTTAGCKCNPPTGVIIPPITTELAWKAAYELLKAENARLLTIKDAALRFVKEADDNPRYVTVKTYATPAADPYLKFRATLGYG